MKIKGKGHWEKGHYIAKSNTGYWSKWGGGRYVEDISLPEWKCQSCGETQVNVLPSYTFEYPTGEFIKVCVMCRYMVVRYQIANLFDLVDKVRGTGIFDTIANLMTLPLRLRHERRRTV